MPATKKNAAPAVPMVDTPLAAQTSTASEAPSAQAAAKGNESDQQKVDTAAASTRSDRKRTQKQQGGFESSKRSGPGRNVKRRVGSSGFRGVAFHNVTKRWRARITDTYGDGRQRALGYFDTKEEAAHAFDAAARELGLDEELLNFPNDHTATAEATAGLLAIAGQGSGGSGGKAAVDAEAPAESQADASADSASSSLKKKRRGVRKSTPKSGVKGVRAAKVNDFFDARIKLPNVVPVKHIGRFSTKEEAMTAYDDEARLVGYCVNKCRAIGDFIDSIGYQKVGSETEIRCIRKVTADEARDLVSRTPSGVEIPPVAADGASKFAAFLLDRPGIYKFIGVFDVLKQAQTAIDKAWPERRVHQNYLKSSARKKAAQDA